MKSNNVKLKLNYTQINDSVAECEGIELKWLLIKRKRHLHLTTVTETYVQRFELKFMIFKGTDSEIKLWLRTGHYINQASLGISLLHFSVALTES